jgi:hypothetical protein
MSAQALERARTALAEASKSWGERGEARIATSLRFGDGEEVEILVRKRGRRYDLSDEGAAVRKADVEGSAWLEVAERVVAAQGMNVNRKGVVFVPAVEGRDVASLTVRLAETVVAVYDELLGLEQV